MAPTRQIWDISPPIRPGIPVWPGDTDYQAERVWALDENCPVNVSRLTMSTHTGSHADAPLHYDPQGISAGEMDIGRYLGPCRVVDGRGHKGLISADLIAPFLEPGLERLLVRTYECAPQEQWDASFAAVEPAAVAAMAALGVVLIGVDTPSLDPQDSKTLDAHHMVRRHGLSILEGLILDDVPAGDYELIALPLKLMNLDSTPVRAVLRSIS